uniref:Uncharacterized protein n=1 Tax=Aegilops tauschii TaxID=37682 RepID=M8B027_AEGTA
MAPMIFPSLPFSIFTVGIQPTKQKRQLFQIKQIDRQEERLPGVLTAGGSSYSATTTTWRGGAGHREDDDVAPDPPLRSSGAAPDPPLGRCSPSMPPSPRSSASTSTSMPPWSRSSSPAQKISIFYLWSVSGGRVVEKWRWKRERPVANMKKEIDAIRVKDISQGGLTQGQQTQIARNEQRISQIMEELENLEETLNDSIQESLGARAGKPKRGSHKASLEEEDDVISDDDEFFDRTKKKSSNPQSSGQQSVETADSLLDKKDFINNDIEGKKKLLEEEKIKLAQRDNADLGDDLDAYMSGLSSQLDGCTEPEIMYSYTPIACFSVCFEYFTVFCFLIDLNCLTVHDNIAKIQKELSDLQAELDKVVYLLKVADPMGEAARKRDLKPREAKPQASNDNPRPESKKQDKIAQDKTSTEENLKDSCSTKTEVDKPAEVETDVPQNQENASKPAFTIPKPQWLGDKRIIEPEENCIKEGNTNAEEPDDFVDYKDRKTILSNSANEKDIEGAAPGLIIRKRKSADQSAGVEAESSSVESEASAADAVALLLKHTRGLQPAEDIENENEPQASKRKGKKSKQKRVLGPARPDFLEAGPDHETWVPPQGQTGDGRTSLNDRLGY